VTKILLVIRQNELIRFIAAGALNTVSTYGLYVGLSFALPYLAAYSVAYATGIVVSYVLNARFVFRQPLSLRQFTRFPLVYLLQYGIGALVLRLAVHNFSMDSRLAFMVSLSMSVPMTFLASRWLLSRKSVNEENIGTSCLPAPELH